MNEELKEKLKIKIAISQIKNEGEVDMNKKVRLIIRNIGIAVCTLISMSGVAFAGNKVIEKIWKTPEKVENVTSLVTEESKKENILEEQAKEIAINKFEQIGFGTNIVKTNHYKDIDSNRITYRFSNEECYEMSIDGQTGKFISIWNNSGNTQDRNITITEDEAKEIAMEYYKLFGFKDGEYEITSVWSNNKEANGKGPGFKIDIIFNKKYGETYNPFERIDMAIESKNKEFDYVSITEIPFDNNEIIITEEEAIQIALKEDEKIETNKIETIKAKQMIVKMNVDAYKRINNNEKYYVEMNFQNFNGEIDYYKIDDRIRNAWVVVITYEDTYGDEIMKRYTEGQYSYFVDCTTGEIIGGHVMDYTYKS